MIVFRISALILFLALVMIRTYFTLILKRGSRVKHDNSLKYAFTGLLIFLSRFIILAYVFFPFLISRFEAPLPVFLRFSGIALGAISASLLTYVHLSLGNSWNPSVYPLENTRLVTNGAYRYIRHPMYSLSLMVEVSFFLITSNALILIFGVLISLFLLSRANIEESLLVNKFGDHYLSYMKGTNRFLPFIK